MEHAISFVLVVLLILYAVVTELLDWRGRVDVIREYLPKFPGFAEKRKFRLVLLFVAVGLRVRTATENGGPKTDVAHSTPSLSQPVSPPSPSVATSDKIQGKDSPQSVTAKPRRNAEKPATPPSAPSVGSITQGPGSIAQVGGVGNQATIIGAVPPPPRRLSEQQLSALTVAVSVHPSKILILYTQHDEGAYGLAKQIGDALMAAGWTLKQPPTEAMIFSEGGAPLRGMEVTWHGDDVPPGSIIHFDPSTPWGPLSAQLMRAFPQEFHVHPAPGQEVDSITLTIFSNPTSRL